MTENYIYFKYYGQDHSEIKDGGMKGERDTIHS